MATIARQPRLIPLREAAWQLDVHPETLRRAVADGKIAAVRLGPRGWLKFRPEDIEAFIAGEARARAEGAFVAELIREFDATPIDEEDV